MDLETVQETLLRHAASWLDAAGAGEETDRAAAEAAVQRWYGTAGLAPPERFIWLPSPAHAATAYRILQGHPKIEVPHAGSELYRETAAILDGCGLGGGGEVGDHERLAKHVQPYEFPMGSVTIGKLGLRDVDRFILEQPWGLAFGQEYNHQWRSVFAYNRLVAGHGGFGLGPAWFAGWYAVLETAWELGTAAPVTLAEAELAVGRHVPWWDPYKEFCMLVPRPVVFRTDAAGRLHAWMEPAAVWREPGETEPALEIFAWKGRAVQKDDATGGLTVPRILTEPDVLTQEALLEIYGEERFLLDAPGEVLAAGGPDGGSWELVCIRGRYRRWWFALRLLDGAAGRRRGLLVASSQEHERRAAWTGLR